MAARGARGGCATLVSESATVTIDSIATGGAGVGRLDGMAVFVPRTAPGDEVRVTLHRRKRHAEGRLRQLVTASARRVEARCPHYDTDRCGGCQLQHLDIAAQRDAKRDMVQQALRRIARRDIVVDDVVPSPLQWRYRRKLTLTLRQNGEGWRGGLRPFDDPDKVFALGDCHIASDAIIRAWQEVRAGLTLLPPGAEFRAELLEAPDGVSLTLIGGGELWADAQVQEFLARCPSLAGLRLEGPYGGRLLRGSGSRAFVQVNPAMAAIMEAHILALVAAGPSQRVIDAFGGRGERAARLAASGARVTLIELDAEATQEASRTLGASVRVITARVEEALPDALPADLVVLNPPRTGVDARVCDTLEGASKDTGRLIYVSCDPATLARDLSRLPSWKLERVTPFDMFPQTAHIESVCLLSRIAS